VIGLVILETGVGAVSDELLEGLAGRKVTVAEGRVSGMIVRARVDDDGRLTALVDLDSVVLDLWPAGIPLTAEPILGLQLPLRAQAEET
jgi:hypothetical protein